MIEMKVDALGGEFEGVQTRVKGPGFAVKAEITAMVHTLLMNYAHVSEMTYDAAKLEVMCKIADAEQKIGQEAFDREFRENTVNMSEDQ